jgi:hypothetical protein
LNCSLFAVVKNELCIIGCGVAACGNEETAFDSL